MPKIYYLLLACFLSVNFSSSQSCFSKSSLLQHVKTLSSDSFEGRRTGTEGAIKTKKYIINQFYSLKVKPLGKTFEQSFSFSQHRRDYKGVNVLGFIKGTLKPEKYIVISAHYDHEGVKHERIYNGADDNASGVSALFSFAEHFQEHPPKHSVILAAFDAEELGLQGSKYYVKHPVVPSKQIIANVNMDMISRSDKNELFAVGTSFNENLKSIVKSYKSTCGKVKLIAGHDGYDGLDNWTYSSDHASFYKAGIPFLYFGVEDHEDYHKPTDDYENIHPEFYTEAVNVIISVFKKIDNSSF